MRTLSIPLSPRLQYQSNSTNDTYLQICYYSLFVFFSQEPNLLSASTLQCLEHAYMWSVRIIWAVYASVAVAGKVGLTVSDATRRIQDEFFHIRFLIHMSYQMSAKFHDI